MSPMLRALRRDDTTRAEPALTLAGPPGSVDEQLRMLSRNGQPTVAILLSTYNGEAFLTAQLHSFLTQTHPAWTLYWRDDGSTDGSARLVRDFASQAGEARCVFPPGGGCRQITRSFLALLRAARAGAAAYFAFSDQDDVWLPEKLARGIAALEAVPAGQPALYCAQRIVVDSDLGRTGEPGRLRHPPGFPAALTQNIAPGCTMMLNRAAADLVLASNPPDTVWHDWWCYVIVAAVGGRVIAELDADRAVSPACQQSRRRAPKLVAPWHRGAAAWSRTVHAAAAPTCGDAAGASGAVARRHPPAACGDRGRAERRPHGASQGPGHAGPGAANPVGDAGFPGVVPAGMNIIVCGPQWSPRRACCPTRRPCRYETPSECRACSAGAGPGRTQPAVRNWRSGR